MGGINWGWLGVAPKSWNKKASEFFSGTPEERENVSTLRPEQEMGFNNLQNAANAPGAQGAYGTAADYYRSLMDENNSTYTGLAAPEMRNFNEQIIPDLSEQFAGMGAGGLSSSGFRNAAVSAGTDLSERLGAIRANLRQQGAQGLQNIGQQALGNYSQNMVTQQGSPGFLSQAAPAVAKAGLAYATGGASLPFTSGFGQSSPYGNQRI